MSEVVSVFKKYMVFSGRSRRREYWFFVVFTTLSMFILSFVDIQLNLFLGGNPLLTSLFWAAVIVPSFAVMTRRLHDTGKSGIYFFIAIIPIYGPIRLFIQLIKKGVENSNEYGDNPKFAA